MPTTAEIADAVVSELNVAAEFVPRLTAVRAYLPLYDLGEMHDLHITVVPTSRTTTPAHRSALQIDHRIDVAVQQKVAVEDPAAVDPVLGLVERIATYLANRPLGQALQAQWVSCQHGPFIAPEHLHELRQVTSILAVTYRTWEPA